MAGLQACRHVQAPHWRGAQVAPTAETQGPLGSRPVDTTQRTWGYPLRTVGSLRACIGPMARWTFYP